MGWRARIGVLYPADGDSDDELWKFVPEGSSIHITRTGVQTGEMTVEKIITEAESPDLETAASLLCTIQLDCIAYLCTAMSFIRGAGYDLEIVQRLQQATGLPATTTSTALVNALHSVSVHRLTVVAPYPESVTEKLAEFLYGNGFEVVTFHSMGIAQGNEIGNVSPQDLYRVVRKADNTRAEGVFISCTNLHTAEILDALEQDLAKPVLSANQVTLWHSLILSGVHSKMQNLGSLYATVLSSRSAIRREGLK